MDIRDTRKILGMTQEQQADRLREIIADGYRTTPAEFARKIGSNVDERVRLALLDLKGEGFAMSDFAAETGTAKQNVSAFMHGRRGALIVWLEALARHGFSSEWLLLGTGEKRKL